MTDRDKITCGKCRSEYYPRFIEKGAGIVLEKDYSCPVCSQNSRTEVFNGFKQSREKLVLKD